MQNSSLSELIQSAREKLRAGRERLRKQHELGTPGLQLTQVQTDLVDSLILELYQAAIADLGLEKQTSHFALIAHGGYGRCDLAPYSDCDLMLTPTRRAEASIQPLAARLSRDIVDIGLELGFSVRRPEEACHLAWRDPVIFSSLSESRLLTGSVQVFGKFFQNLRHGAMRRHRTLIQAVYQARREERGKWGETGYLLRPNVKRSRGGLRDIQLIRWLGFARYGDSDLDKLLHHGAISKDDYSRLRKALAFLLRLRNELHFDSGRSQDILDRPAQMRIAERWGYQESEGRLPVEAFMRDYFEHTREVRYSAAHFVDTVRHRPVVSRSLDVLLSRRIHEDFRMGPLHVWVRDVKLDSVASDVTSVLELMELANRYEKRISHRTWQAIRDAMRGRDVGPPSPDAAQRFLALLDRPGRLADLIRRLHELRVLEQLIPGMRHARCLLQFNQYHKYTVDAHSIRAVESATQFTERTDEVGQLYASLEKPWLLHLSLLIHDLGKGFDRDHCELGCEIAAETADRLFLQEDEKEIVKTIVLHHLLMIHTALRHDLSDQDVISHFADTIGSIPVLDLLFLHSLCDLNAVGPGVLTDWKEKLITELYHRSRLYLLEGRSLDRTDQRISRVRTQVSQLLKQGVESDQTMEILSWLPPGLLDQATPEQIAADLHEAAKLNEDHPVFARGADCVNEEGVEYTVIFLEGGRRVGWFKALTGALNSKGLKILRSQIHTFDSGLAWDQFVVRDPDFNSVSRPDRIKEICQTLEQVIREPTELTPKFRKVWGEASEEVEKELRVLPSRVKFDNGTSDRYTIMNVYAYDRPGLLYSLATTIADNHLIIHFAKIATSLDQAVDVFYVTYRDGRRIEDPEEQSRLRNALIDAAENG